jgi:hypothetical protein
MNLHITLCCFKIHFNIILPSVTLSSSMFNTGNSMHTDEYGQLLQQIRWKNVPPELGAHVPSHMLEHNLP